MQTLKVEWTVEPSSQAEASNPVPLKAVAKRKGSHRNLTQDEKKPAKSSALNPSELHTSYRYSYTHFKADLNLVYIIPSQRLHEVRSISSAAVETGQYNNTQYMMICKHAGWYTHGGFAPSSVSSWLSDLLTN